MASSKSPRTCRDSKELLAPYKIATWWCLSIWPNWGPLYVLWDQHNLPPKPSSILKTRGGLAIMKAKGPAHIELRREIKAKSRVAEGLELIISNEWVLWMVEDGYISKMAKAMELEAEGRAIKIFSYTIGYWLWWLLLGLHSSSWSLFWDVRFQDDGRGIEGFL